MTTRERSNRLEIKRFRYRRCSSWERCRSTASTFRVIASETAGRQSALITTLTRGARAATASTARCTTAITSAQLSPSIKVNIASVLFGSPDSRTTRTASATISPTPSPTPNGVTENATNTDTSDTFPRQRAHLNEIPTMLADNGWCWLCRGCRLGIESLRETNWVGIAVRQQGKRTPARPRCHRWREPTTPPAAAGPPDGYI